eukprot:3218163-Karenia_brevis.AAC.1
MHLKQIVKHPTRAGNLLDLALTDIPGAKAHVLPAISDHNVVSVELPVTLSETMSVEREGWAFHKADWERLQESIMMEDWTWLANIHPETGAQQFTDIVMQHMENCIPRKLIKERKSTHPWLTERVTSSVSDKLKARGTNREDEAIMKCSQ